MRVAERPPRSNRYGRGRGLPHRDGCAAPGRPAGAPAPPPGLRIARRHEQPRLAVDDELRRPADARRDDRQARGHRLEDRERRALGAAREHEDVGRPPAARRDVVTLARQLDHRLQTRAGASPPRPRSVGPVADDRRLERTRPKLGERPHERQRVLRRRAGRRSRAGTVPRAGLAAPRSDSRRRWGSRRCRSRGRSAPPARRGARSRRRRSSPSSAG